MNIYYMNIYCVLLVGSGFLLVLVIGQLFVPHKTDANNFLCLLLIVCFVWLAHGIGFRLGMLNTYPHMNNLHIPFLAATGPLWYTYVRTLVTNTAWTQSDAKHFFPVALCLTLSVPFLFQPAEYKLAYIEPNINGSVSLLMYLAIRVADVATLLYSLLAISLVCNTITTPNSKSHIRYTLYGLSCVAVFAALSRLLGSVTGNHTLSAFMPIAVILAGVISLYWLSYRHPWLISPGEKISRPKQPSSKGQQLLNGYREKIREQGWHLNPDLKVQELARRLGVPAHDLSELINKESGANFNTFVNELRIGHAKSLLLAGNQSIIDIVHASGYNSQSAFYEQFKRFESISPAKFRQKRAQY